MQKILMYDCEIINLIMNVREPIDRRYSYCGGWRDFEGMGISVVGTWRNYDLRYHRERCITLPRPLGKYEAFVNSSNVIGLSLFALYEFDYLQRLLWGADVVVGFNSIAFDDKLMCANGLEVTTTYDLLCETRIAVGQPPHYTRGVTTGGYSLANLAQANGMTKTGTGALAPMLWQDGKKQQVIDYCLNDVKLLHDLYWRKQNGMLRDPVSGKLL